MMRLIAFVLAFGIGFLVGKWAVTTLFNRGYNAVLHEIHQSYLDCRSMNSTTFNCSQFTLFEFLEKPPK